MRENARALCVCAPPYEGHHLPLVQNVIYALHRLEAIASSNMPLFSLSGFLLFVLLRTP